MRKRVGKGEKAVKVFQEELESALVFLVDAEDDPAVAVGGVAVKAEAVVAGEKEEFDVVGVTHDEGETPVVRIVLHHEEVQHRHNDLREKLQATAMHWQGSESEDVRECGVGLAEILDNEV